MVLTAKRPTSEALSFTLPCRRSFTATIGKRRLPKKCETEVRTQRGDTFSHPLATGAST